MFNITDEILDEGTFGIVKIGFRKTLGIKCAVKIGNFSYYSNALREASYLQKITRESKDLYWMRETLLEHIPPKDYCYVLRFLD